MLEVDLRVFVDRLLKGDFRPADVMQILLYARQHTEGRQSVEEIGDYFAHIQERTKGAVTKGARDFYTFARWRLHYIDRPIDIGNLPAATADALRANLRRMHPVEIRKACGLTKLEAKENIESFAAKLGFKNFGLVSPTSPITASELAAFRCVSNTMMSRPLFTGDELFSDLCAILHKQKLLSNKEFVAFEIVKPGILLYATAVMHRSVISLGKDYATLEAMGTRVSEIQVFATAAAVGGGKHFGFGYPVFTTTLRIKDFCEGSLLTSDLWPFPIEVTSQQKLRRADSN